MRKKMITLKDQNEKLSPYEEGKDKEKAKRRTR